MIIITADYIYEYQPDTSHSIETETTVESIMKPSSSELPIKNSTGSSKETTKASTDTQTFRDDHIAMSSTHVEATTSNIPRNHSNDATAIKNSNFLIDDKEVYVIDKEEIDESTKNSKVIVLNPSDLCEKLGSNWPSSAGAAGDVLNGDRSSNVVEANKRSSSQRNKSPNILNHFNNSKRASNGSTYGSRSGKFVKILIVNKRNGLYL